MSVVELNCPKCGATIHAEEDLASFDCPCCGSRIVLPAQTDTPVVRSTPTVKTGEKPMKTKKRKSPLRGVVAAVLAVAVLGGAGIIGSRVFTREQISESVESVRSLIDHKDFSRARSELGRLFDSHLFYKNKWNSTKDALAKEIDQKEQEYLANIKREVPMSKKEAEKGTVDSVVSAFTEAGFTHIIQVPITDTKENKKAEDQSIKEITIMEDGEEKKDFKAGESIKTNSEITITFYDFSASPAVPMSAGDARNKDKDEVKSAFEKAGFSNVVLVSYVEPVAEPKQETSKVGEFVGNVVGAVENAAEKVTDLFSKEDNSGKVQAVSIQDEGKEITDFKKGERFSENALITVIYYE